VPPPPVVSDSQVRPSLGWFVFAGGVALAGIVGAVVLWVMGVARLSDRIDDFSRVAVPSSGEVEIDDPGGYSIYHEYFGADSDGDSDRFDFEPSVSVTVTDPSGDGVLLRDYTSSVTYDFSGHEGVGIYTFDAEQAGTYQVETTGDSTSTIAVGQGIGRGIVSTIVGGFVVGGLGVVAGIVIAIVTGVRRGRSRRMLNAARWAQAGPPGPGGWGAPPGGGWGPPPGGWGGQQPGPPQPGPPPWASP
jgi:hypothetical protein